MLPNFLKYVKLIHVRHQSNFPTQTMRLQLCASFPPRNGDRVLLLLDFGRHSMVLSEVTSRGILALSLACPKCLLLSAEGILLKDMLTGIGSVVLATDGREGRDCTSERG